MLAQTNFAIIVPIQGEKTQWGTLVVISSECHCPTPRLNDLSLRHELPDAEVSNIWYEPWLNTEYLFCSIFMAAGRPTQASPSD